MEELVICGEFGTRATLGERKKEVLLKVGVDAADEDGFKDFDEVWCGADGKSFFEERAELLKKTGAGHLEFEKAPHSTGEGDRYEEATLALVFLRSVRTGLRFTLSSNDAAAGKFDDVVLWWSNQQSPSGSAMLVQLKHKTSAKQTTIRRASLMEGKKDFSIEVYHESYKKIRDSLEGGNYALVLSTNLGLHEDALTMFVRHEPKSIPGMELLDSDGKLYKLNPYDENVKYLVQGDDKFVQHFYLFCNQSSNKSIRNIIHTELKLTLGADESCHERMCDDLCGNLREWMNSQNVCLTSSWGRWLNIVDKYIRDKVTTCNSVITKKIQYGNVATLQAYLEGRNPAWIRPPEREAAVLTATKVHQIIHDEKHIMVSVTRLTELEEKIQCCWGPFCPWLVIVDDHDGGKHSYDILDRLRELAEPNRRLVIVSDKRRDSFLDTYKSYDILQESWEELLKVEIMLNSEQYSCRLGDLCDTDSLKAMLDENPKALAALSQLSGPVRMGQDLDPLPENHIGRQLTCHMHVRKDFFSSLGDKEVCIMNELSYGLLTNKVVMKNTIKFHELEKYLSVSDSTFPLFVVTSNIDCSAVQMISSKCVDVRMYVLSHVNDEWLYVEEQSISLLNIVHRLNNRVIIEGKPGVGKSTMLLDMARQLKGQDPSWWILRIDLLKYSEVFESSDSGFNASEYILTRVVYNEENLGIRLLEHSILQHCLRQYPRIVCLVDGFDEICPDYADKCLQALQELAPGRGKLVVATRPSVAGRLEAALGAPAHTLPAFSDKQLEEFHNRPLSDMGVTDKVRELLKIPLFSRMYADSLKSGDIIEDIVSLYEAFFERKFRRLYEEKLGDDLSKPGNRKMFQRERMEHEKHLTFLAVSHLLPALEVPCIVQLTSEDTDDLVKAGVIYKFIDDKPVFIHRTFAEHFLAKWCFSKAADSRRADVYRKALSDASLEFFVESFDRMASEDRPLLLAVLNHRETEVKSLLENGADGAERDKWGRSSLHLAAVYSRDSTILRLLVGSLEVVGGSASAPAEETRRAQAAPEVDQKPMATESVGVASNSCLVQAPRTAGQSWVKDLVGADGPSRYEVFQAVTTALGALDGLLQWPPLRYAAERRRWRAVEYLLEAGAQLRHLGDFQRGLHNPQKLWEIFEKDGYNALFDHILGSDKPGWSSQMLERGAENKKTLEIKVAVSIIHREMSRRQYKEIICEANKNDNFVVAKLLSLKWMELIKTSASPALDLRQISSGACLLGEFIPVVLNGAELSSSPLQWMGKAAYYTILRNSAEEKLINAVVRGDVNSVQQQIKAVANVNALAYYGRSAIHVAAVADNVQCIRSLLSVGAKVNLKDTICKTPLHYAAEMGRLQSVKVLLAAGADPIVKDSIYLTPTPLHLAARAGNAECVRVLAGAAADNLEVRDLGGFTALHSAAFRGEAECVKQLLAAGAHPSPVTNKMNTPLHYAAQNGNAECVRLLVQAGAAVAARGDSGIVALHRAAMSGNPDCLREVLATGADVNEKDGEGRTPLHCAVQSGNPDCVRLLLEAKADVLANDGKGDTPLHWAAEGRSPACVELLLENRADAKARNNNGATPLHFAAHKGEAACVKLLLAAGAHSSAVDDYLNTPLYCAAEKGNAECVRLLVEAGADVAARNDKGATARHSAARSGNPDCVRLLLEARADVHDRDGYGETPLHCAAREGGPACITLLLEKGADVNARNNNGVTPLHCAVQSGNPDCVKLLLEARADVHDKDGDGETPLHWAARLGSPACIRLLLDKRAYVNARNNSGATALHCAAMSDNPDSVRHLLDAGADVQKKDGEGLTPLDWAVMADSPAYIRLLLEKRANEDERNSNGVTPLHFAAHSGDAELVKQLLEGGADPLAPDQLSVTPLHVAASRKHVVCFILLLCSAWDRYQARQ